MTNIAYQLVRHNALDFTSWLAHDPETAEDCEHKNIHNEILHMARLLYCSYGLDQTIAHRAANIHISEPLGSSEILGYISRMGFNAHVFCQTIVKWMSTRVTALYVVGDYTSGAPFFARLLRNVFQMVANYHLNQFDLKHFQENHKTIKLLYFPAVPQQQVFQDAHANSLIAGEKMELINNGELEVVSKMHSIVHLLKMPSEDQIPTDCNSHVILQFPPQITFENLFCHDTDTLVVLLYHFYKNTIPECLNPSGLLCNRHFAPPCNICADRYIIWEFATRQIGNTHHVSAGSSSDSD